MSPGEPPELPARAANWRDGAGYRHLLDVDRAGWAWEWLRRNPAYKGTQSSIDLEAQRLGHAVVTVVRGQDDKEGPKWGLTFCRVSVPTRNLGPAGVGCGQRCLRPGRRSPWPGLRG